MSLVISNWNRLVWGSFRCKSLVDSVQWQDYKDFELIVADGGSENFEELKYNFESYNGDIPMKVVRYDLKKWNRSLMNNVGIRHAKGDYIVISDSDMIFNKRFMSEISSRASKGVMVEGFSFYLSRAGHKILSKGKIDIYNDFKYIISPSSNPNKKSKIKSFGRYYKSPGGCQCLHRDIWYYIRGFDERYEGWGYEDYELLRRITRRIDLPIQVIWTSNLILHQPHKLDIHKRKTGPANRKLGSKGMNTNLNGWGGVYYNQV